MTDHIDRVVALVGCWSVTGDSTANAAKTVTKDAEAGKTHYITAIDVVISAAAAANDISIVLKSNTTAKWTGYIGNAAVRGTPYTRQFSQPIQLTAGEAANLVVAAGGSNVITSVNMAGYTK